MGRFAGNVGQKARVAERIVVLFGFFLLSVDYPIIVETDVTWGGTLHQMSENGRNG